MDQISATSSNLHNFGITDYVVFLLTLIISSGIGIYFGFSHGKNSSKTTEDYLLGGRRMKILPIAISLMASQISGIAIMAIPAEIYVFGTQYWMIVVSITIVVLIINTIFIPVFYNNNISCCYEYLEARFSKFMRKVITAMFLITHTIFIPVVIYIPAIAFNQVTGFNTHLSNFIITSICIIYTMLGGIKAVVWTDVFQFTVMIISCVTVAVMAVTHVGGFSKVWTIAEEGNRLEFFNLSLDLTTRHTFWSTILGYIAVWLPFIGLNQSCVQRIISLPTLQHAQRALWLFIFGCVFMNTLNCYIGVVMYANYADCDPLQAGIVDKPDKMIPYFVQSIVGHLKGMPGLFVSCVFCAALSTMSASLNTLSALYYYEYIAKLHLFKHNDANSKFAMQILIIVIGMYSVVMGFVVAQFKYILQLVITLGGITQGATLGVFLLGMLLPKCNNIGALAGILVSILFNGFVIIGAQIKTFRGEIIAKTLPTSVDGCSEMKINITNLAITILGPADKLVQENESFSIFEISFAWYTLMGTIITMVVGVIVSSCFKSADYTHLHSNLFPPCIHWLLPKEIIENSIEMKIVEKISVSQPLVDIKQNTT